MSFTFTCTRICLSRAGSRAFARLRGAARVLQLLQPQHTALYCSAAAFRTRAAVVVRFIHHAVARARARRFCARAPCCKRAPRAAPLYARRWRRCGRARALRTNRAAPRLLTPRAPTVYLPRRDALTCRACCCVTAARVSSRSSAFLYAARVLDRASAPPIPGDLSKLLRRAARRKRQPAAAPRARAVPLLRWRDAGAFCAPRRRCHIACASPHHRTPPALPLPYYAYVTAYACRYLARMRRFAFAGASVTCRLVIFARGTTLFARGT